MSEIGYKPGSCQRRPGLSGGAIARCSIYVALLASAFIYALPLLWMLSTSVKPTDQTLVEPPRVLPSPVSSLPRVAAENYRAVWQDPTVHFPLYFRNTLIVTCLSLIGMVLSSSICAYGFARLRWRGRETMFALLLMTMMIPFPVLMGPLYVIFKNLGWIGSFKPLWAPAWLAFGGGFNIFLLRQFYRTIPPELDEAAQIDGCSHWGIYWRIILPLSKPALAVVALFHFIFVWNDFLGPLIFLTHEEQFTLALGLQLYQSKGGATPWNLLMAASLLVIAPVLIVFLLAQRTFVEGIATQGLKE